MFNRAESNYSVTHQETLAVVWALKHFRDIILGYPITVFMNHAAVTELLKVETLQANLHVGTSPFKNLIPPSGISWVA